MSREALLEALKELGRLVFFGVVSIAITFVLDKLANIPQTETVVIVTSALRFLDKYVHERSKEVKKPALKGIAPF